MYTPNYKNLRFFIASQAWICTAESPPIITLIGEGVFTEESQIEPIELGVSWKWLEGMLFSSGFAGLDVLVKMWEKAHHAAALGKDGSPEITLNRFPLVFDDLLYKPKELKNGAWEEQPEDTFYLLDCDTQ